MALPAGSRTRNPPSTDSIGMSAARTRTRMSATAAAVGSATSKWRRPMAPGGGGGAPPAAGRAGAAGAAAGAGVVEARGLDLGDVQPLSAEGLVGLGRVDGVDLAGH